MYFMCNVLHSTCNRIKNIFQECIIEKAKETILVFSKETVKLLWFYFVSIKHYYKMSQYNT